MALDPLPIACSLDASELHRRAARWEKLLTGTAIARDRIPNGISFTVPDDPEVTNELNELIRLERECCEWIRWTWSGRTVKATADGATGADALAEMFAVS